MMNAPTEDLLRQIESYAPVSGQKASSLRESEPYLFVPVSQGDGEIHGNDDYRIEELTDDDLDIPLDFV